jgi:hypothetical protein
MQAVARVLGEEGSKMKLDLDAVEEHARSIAALSKRSVSWRVRVGSSGLVTLIFEDDYGHSLDIAGAETFAMVSALPWPPGSGD